jgi:dihydroorotase
VKIIDAICVTSQSMQREKIIFDELTGLIVERGFTSDTADFYYNDDCLLFAGMGDVHIHAREDVSGKNNYKEDFLTAQKAMHNGGVCHAGDMPNNPVPPIDDQSYIEKLKLALKARGELWLYAGIGPSTRPLSYKVPYKVYMGPSVGELFFKDLDTLDHALSFYKGQVVSFHCEDPLILDEHKNQGVHHDRRPVIAETVATRDALELIKKYSLQGKLCHYSSGEGLSLIRKARLEGVKVQIEVTPQHLYFDQEILDGNDMVKYQMNPPIRPAIDRKLMMEALKNGEIDFLATDHAPHTQEEKLKGTSGLTGLDTFGPFVTWLIEQGINPKLIAKMTSENPGTFFNQFLESWATLSREFKLMGSGVGFLEKNYRANFTILNLNRSLTITKDILKTKVGHSPFENVTFPGQVEALFIGGKKI